MCQKDLLIGYLHKNVDEEFDPEQDNLLEIMDSVSLLQLIVFIEQEMDVCLDMSMLGIEAFASVDSLLDTLAEQAA